MYIAVILLLAFAISPVAAQSPTPAERLEKLTTATSLDRDGLNPWHLRMNFQLFDLDGKQQDTGTVDAWWTGKDHPQLYIESPAIKGALPPPEEAFAQGKGREAFLIRELLSQVVHPMPAFGEMIGLSASERDRAFGKTTLHCLRIESTHGKSEDDSPGTAPEFCYQPADEDVLRIRFDGGHLSVVRNRLARFQNVNVAFDNEISYNAKRAIVGHTQSLESFEPSALPPEARPQPVLSSTPGLIAAGRILKKSAPQYPYFDKQRGIMGSVVLSAIVGQDGRVKDIVPIASRDPQLTGSATAAVKDWIYKPFEKDGKPIAVDTTIVVNYNLINPNRR